MLQDDISFNLYVAFHIVTDLRQVLLHTTGILLINNLKKLLQFRADLLTTTHGIPDLSHSTLKALAYASHTGPSFPIVSMMALYGLHTNSCISS